ncbi:MAG TPA: CRISPR-associated protein Csx15 [Dictyobacter sp.]|jgi:hypothetical protein|nr:CRISPR-associated protein Csx15 [Dictyobacter sp.]
MLILNFSHPLTEQQQQQIETFAAQPIEEVRSIKVQIDQDQPLAPQISAIVETIGLTSEEWQTCTLLINPPGYAPAAFVLLAELHGLIGHFPAIIRIRPGKSAVTNYEVAELLNLQAIRDESRTRR